MYRSFQGQTFQIVINTDYLPLLRKLWLEIDKPTLLIDATCNIDTREMVWNQEDITKHFEYIGEYTDDYGLNDCLCGKTSIHKVVMIHNTTNGSVLLVGKDCAQHFY